MRIHQRDLTDAQKKTIETAINELEHDRQGRVCGSHCKMVCTSCGATQCQCQCSAECPAIPAHLSSDPEKYPIEETIAPLVFEMHRLGVIEPCWSCEGHNGLDGKLWKRPAVWFYCDDVTHLRLLADVVEGLFVARKLNFQWQIRITYSDVECPDTVFALEPERRRLADAKLVSMHEDIRILTENLYDMVHEHARRVKNTL